MQLQARAALPVPPVPPVAVASLIFNSPKSDVADLDIGAVAASATTRAACATP